MISGGCFVSLAALWLLSMVVDCRKQKRLIRSHTKNYSSRTASDQQLDFLVSAIINKITKFDLAFFQSNINPQDTYTRPNRNELGLLMTQQKWLRCNSLKEKLKLFHRLPTSNSTWSTASKCQWQWILFLWKSLKNLQINRYLDIWWSLNARVTVFP